MELALQTRVVWVLTDCSVMAETEVSQTTCAYVEETEVLCVTDTADTKPEAIIIITTLVPIPKA